METLPAGTGVCPEVSWEQTGRHDRIQSVNKGWGVAVFPRKKCPWKLNRTTWARVRGRNKAGVDDMTGWGVLPPTAGRTVAISAETRSSGEGWVSWKKSWGLAMLVEM